MGTMGSDYMNLAELRIKAGYPTQSEFAKVIGVKRNTICRWENGKRKPSINIIPKLAINLNVSSDAVILAYSEGYLEKEI